MLAEHGKCEIRLSWEVWMGEGEGGERNALPLLSVCTSEGLRKHVKGAEYRKVMEQVDSYSDMIR